MVCPKCKLTIKLAKVEDGKRLFKCINPKCGNYGKISAAAPLSNSNENNKEN